MCHPNFLSTNSSDINSDLIFKTRTPFMYLVTITGKKYALRYVDDKMCVFLANSGW